MHKTWMKIVGLMVAVIVINGCSPPSGDYYAAPSGHFQDGIPEEADIIVSTSHDRYYKYKNCMVKQYWNNGQWVTNSVEC